MKEINQRLLKLIENEFGLPAADISNIKELVSHNEPGIGLESFCEQLFEYDIKINQNILSEIRVLGEEMKMNPKYWEILSIK